MTMRNGDRAFTIVELLIVFAMIAVLAMIVVPDFSSASDDARESALASDMQTIARQIALYRIEHEGRLPHIKEDGSADNDVDKFIQRLTGRTTPLGKIDSGGECGPYMLEWPTNPFALASVASDINLGDAAAPPRTNASGWYYNTDTGEVWPNSAEGGESITPAAAE
jgi:general secretion pathway protein G